MTSRISKLAVAAVLAASTPALAAAGDRDCDHGRPVPVVVTAPVHAAPPAYVPAPPPAWRDHRGPDRSWRARELAAVRSELARLDAERADFHARHAYRPGKLRKYDRWYFERRAALERREHELLARYAWR